MNQPLQVIYITAYEIDDGFYFNQNHSKTITKVIDKVGKFINLCVLNYKVMLLSILLIITVVFLCIMVYVLFAPLLVEIDSHNYTYQFRVVPIFRLWWVSDKLFGHPEMSIFGIHKKISFSNLKDKTTPLKQQSTNPLNFSFQRFFAIIKSCKVKKCVIDIDTGNMPLNGKLFPLMYMLSGLTGKTFHINFTGKNEIVLTIKNNVYSILKAYIKNK